MQSNQINVQLEETKITQDQEFNDPKVIQDIPKYKLPKKFFKIIQQVNTLKKQIDTKELKIQQKITLYSSKLQQTNQETQKYKQLETQLQKQQLKNENLNLNPSFIDKKQQYQQKNEYLMNQILKIITIGIKDTFKNNKKQRVSKKAHNKTQNNIILNEQVLEKNIQIQRNITNILNE